MTKEKLLERLNALQRDKDQLIATFHAIDGAMQEAKHWLSVFNEAAMTLDEFKEVIGADSVEIVEKPAS